MTIGKISGLTGVTKAIWKLKQILNVNTLRNENKLENEKKNDPRHGMAPSPVGDSPGESWCEKSVEEGDGTGREGQ